LSIIKNTKSLFSTKVGSRTALISVTVCYISIIYVVANQHNIYLHRGVYCIVQSEAKTLIPFCYLFIVLVYKRVLSAR